MSKITIEYPMTDLGKKHIRLPHETYFSQCVHEIAHVYFTPIDYIKHAKNEEDKETLNTLEDAKVDKIVVNVKRKYAEMYEKMKLGELKGEGLIRVQLILYFTGFYQFCNKELTMKLKKSGLLKMFERVLNEVEKGEYNDVHISELTNKIKEVAGDLDNDRAK